MINAFTFVALFSSIVVARVASNSTVTSVLGTGLSASGILSTGQAARSTSAALNVSSTSIKSTTSSFAQGSASLSLAVNATSTLVSASVPLASTSDVGVIISTSGSASILQPSGLTNTASSVATSISSSSSANSSAISQPASPASRLSSTIAGAASSTLALSIRTTTASQVAFPSSIVSATSAHSTLASSTSTTEQLLTITSYRPDASSVSTILGVTANTRISTGDSSHTSALVPFLWHDDHCWFCPPGGGFLLFGMTAPGVYPPPPNPPAPQWPTITIPASGNPTPDPSEDPASISSASASSPSVSTSTSPASSVASSSTLSSASTIISSSSPTSAQSTVTPSTDPCLRDVVVKREAAHHGLSKRDEKIIASQSPLRSALYNFPSSSALDSAVKLITNKLGDIVEKGGVATRPTANTFVSGLTGLYTIPPVQSLIIDGKKMTSPMSWTIRWDFDPEKQAHVNAEFGKGKGNPTFAYTFASDMPSYGEKYMRDAVRSLTDKARLDVGESHKQGRPVFLQGTDLQEATQTIVSAWKQLIDEPCSANGAPRDPTLDPNGA